MLRKLLWLWGICSLVVHFSLTPVWGQDFYKGKTVRIIVGASAGGGYDTYSRTIARHIGKHIPGNPTFIVENMPGAGFHISANYMYRIAKPDGLMIGHFIGVMILRKAFMETMKDPEFLAEANKARLEIDPLDGAELERNVREVFSLDSSLIQRAQEMLK